VRDAGGVPPGQIVVQRRGPGVVMLVPLSSIATSARRSVAVRRSPVAVLTVATIAAVAVAAGAAAHPWLGVVALAGVATAPIVLGGPVVALGALAAVLFVQRLPPIGLAGTALLLIAGARWWEGRWKPPAANRAPAGSRAMTAVLVGFLLWVGMSLAWARHAAPGETKLGDWAVAAAVFGIVASTLRQRSHVLVVVRGFVAGAVGSVVVGLGAAALVPSSALERHTWFEGRLQGGAGDPNLLAAGLVAAIALSVGALIATRRRSIGRVCLLGALILLVAGLGATQSRGGLVGAIVMAGAAVAVAHGRRRRLAIALGAVAALVAGALAVSPGGLSRVTTPDAEGNGRADLWRVGARMVREHPISGVGLGNFRVRAADFVREPGEVRFAELIAERPHEAHNTYLQLLAEVGVPGLLAFLTVVALALDRMWRAQRRLAALGDGDLAALGQSAFLGAVGMLVSLAFVTDGDDLRLWMLLGLGPALLGIATAPTGRDAAQLTDRSAA
jgi:O-antigen ligase